MRKGVVFATYASLIGESSSGGKYRTRFNQLLHWLGSHYEGIVSSQHQFTFTLHELYIVSIYIYSYLMPDSYSCFVFYLP